jgi:hypothetical protein
VLANQHVVSFHKFDYQDDMDKMIEQVPLCPVLIGTDPMDCGASM